MSLRYVSKCGAITAMCHLQARNVASAAVRSFSTSLRQAASTSSGVTGTFVGNVGPPPNSLHLTASPAYPYAPNATIKNTPVPSNSNMSEKRPNRRGIMAGLHAELKQEYDPSSKLTSLFSRKSSERIPVGSVVLVETYTNATKTGMSTFSGILLAVRRRGVSTSFVIRNIVSKTGVEIRFNLYSPLLKDVKVVQRALAGKDDRSGRLRRTRRAKLYYLRRDNRKLASIGKSIATMRAQQQAQRTPVRSGTQTGAHRKSG